MSEAEDFVCAVSGISVPPAEDGEQPVGWAQITILVRRENPEYAELVQAREILIAQQLSALPEDKREEARGLATIMAKATLASLFLTTPRYLVDEREVHVCEEQLPALLEMLGEADE